MKEQQKTTLTTQEAASQNTGLDLGKFASVEQLLNAYKNLEREFTKKSQQLSELQQAAEFEKTDAASKTQGQNENTCGQETHTQSDELCFKRQDWQQSVEDFLKTHPKSQLFAEAIADFLVKNPQYALGSNPLEIAYLNVLEKTCETPETFASDAVFLERYILGNQDVRQKIILDYLTGLQQMQAPATIGDNGRISLTPPPKPKSIAEASAMAERYLKK